MTDEKEPTFHVSFFFHLPRLNGPFLRLNGPFWPFLLFSLSYTCPACLVVLGRRVKQTAQASVMSLILFDLDPIDVDHLYFESEEHKDLPPHFYEHANQLKQVRAFLSLSLFLGHKPLFSDAPPRLPQRPPQDRVVRGSAVQLLQQQQQQQLDDVQDLRAHDCRGHPVPRTQGSLFFILLASICFSFHSPCIHLLSSCSLRNGPRVAGRRPSSPS